jgi:hypothetical protein
VKYGHVNQIVEDGFKVLPLQFLSSISVGPYMIRRALASLVKKSVIGPGDTVPDRTDTIVVRAPEDQGIVLFRMFINDRDEIARLQESRKGITCTLLK